MIIEENTIEPIAQSLKIRNKKIVLIGGCFDVLHDAHLKFLKRSKHAGDILILLLESDENIKIIKGKNRPINNFENRSEALESLGFIDIIVKLSPKVSDKYYYNLTNLIQPDIIALTKDDPLIKKKKEQADMTGGVVKQIMNRDKKNSSTKLINKI